MELTEVYSLVEPGLSGVDRAFQNLIDNEQDFPEMHEMLRQVVRGGKVIRPTLTLLCGSFYNYDLNILQAMASACELMHIASTVHDDAIDSSNMRHGRPTINSTWGVHMAILLGDFLFARAGEFAAATSNMRVISLFSQTLVTMSSGEARERFCAFRLDQTFEQYIERAAAKTASLFTLSTVSGAILSKAPETSVQIMYDYGQNLGIAFQIVDDILDFMANENDMGKPVGADLMQGTVTLPVQKLLRYYPKDKTIFEIAKKTNLGENIPKVILMIRNSGIIEECYKLAEDYRELACRDLIKLPDKPSREALATMADYAIKRKK